MPSLGAPPFLFCVRKALQRQTRFRKAYNRVGNNRSCARHGFRAGIMFTLNFPNGNVQTYSSWSDLLKAARLLGGDAVQVSGNTYAFVPKK